MEALQCGPQSSSGHGTAQCWALAEVKIVQDASLGQVKKQLPLAPQVHGGPLTCWALIATSEIGHCSRSQK